MVWAPVAPVGVSVQGMQSTAAPQRAVAEGPEGGQAARWPRPVRGHASLALVLVLSPSLKLLEASSLSSIRKSFHPPHPTLKSLSNCCSTNATSVCKVFEGMARFLVNSLVGGRSGAAWP